ncbi:MAG: ATP-grasp domain-containing protein, partial [Desulfatiglandales bacterium]|nr:ATP-grasp domain-containing protein [Desulfatiglandales bacterium]
MNIHILLTCVGSQVAPSVIQTIRDHPRYEIKVVGVDNKKRGESIGAHFVDEYYQVPMGNEQSYIPELEEIVKKGEVKVLLPGSDEESLALSRERHRFSRIGCAVACSDYEVTELVVDKYRLMERLKERSVPVADFFEFRTMSELRECAEKLGFPTKPFVIKPKISRGGRGFRVVQTAVSPLDDFLKGDTTTIDFDSLARIFEGAADEMDKFFVMDYLPGRKYSADVLVKQGKMASVVIRNKIFPVGSPTQVADIVFDKDLIAYALSIMEVLRFDYFVQFEIGRNPGGKPRLIEINPRLDATLPICLGIGVNFYHEMINHALGEEYSDSVMVSKDAQVLKRFFRYWQHCFVPVESIE